MASLLQILASLDGADRGMRWLMAEGVGVIRRRKDRGTWFIDLRPFGRIYARGGVPFRKKKDAERILREIQGKLATRTLPEVLAEYVPKTAKPNLVPARLARWIEVKAGEVEAGRLSPGYLAELRRHAGTGAPREKERPGDHFAFFAGHSIYEINYGLLEDWLGWLAKRGLGPATQRALLLQFRSFVGWLKRRGDLRELPTFPTVTVPEYEPTIITVETQERILAAISEARRGAFLALAYMGLRPGEVRAARVADLAMADERLWLVVTRAAKGPSASSIVRETKNKRGKRVPVHPRVAEWIEQHVDPAGRLEGALLFPNPATGRMWGHEPLRRTWNRAAEAVGVRVPLYQGTKHSSATHLKRAGVEDRVLQKFLGHRARQSVERYARLADTALVDVIGIRQGGSDPGTCPPLVPSAEPAVEAKAKK